MCVVLLLGIVGCGKQGQGKIEGELTISVYKKEEWMEKAARKFEDKYPGVTVTINSFYDPASAVNIYTDSRVTTTGVVPTGQTREDYLSELNTKILSYEHF